MRPKKFSTVLTLAITGLLAAPAAAADGPVIDYTNSSTYKYWLWLMPDIDQRRAGLPNNGNAFCVPTAVLNACAYAGNHGFADEVVCEDFWSLYYSWPPFYDDVTALDATFGAAMSTHSDDGTTGKNGLIGAKWAMDNGFLVLRYARNGGYWPNYDDIAAVALTGALIVPIVGWYPDEFQTSRDGGHALTLHSLKRSGSNRVIGVCDPASAEGDLTTQSGFTHENYSISREAHFINGGIRIVDRLAGLGGGSKIAIIDAFYAFIPLHAWSWGGKDGFLDYKAPNPWTAVEAITLDSAQPLYKIDIDAATNTLYGLQEVARDVQKIITIDLAHRNENTVLVATDLQDIEMSRLRQLYVLANGRQLSCYNPSREELVLQAQRDAPIPIDAIVYDDLTDELLGFSSDEGKLLAWPKDLVGRAPLSFDVDQNVMGDVSLAIEPDTGIVWIAGSELEHLIGYDRKIDVLSFIEHPLIENVTSVGVTPGGNLLFGNGVASFEITKESVIVENSDWADVGNASTFFPTTVHNYDPETMEGPEWRHEVPDRFTESIPFCYGDFDGSGGVNTRDLIILLSLWGTDDLMADIDGDGDVGTTDLIDVLSRWGRCPGS